MSNDLNLTPSEKPSRRLTKDEILNPKPKFIIYHNPESRFSTNVVNAIHTLPQMRMMTTVKDIRTLQRIPSWLTSFPGIGYPAKRKSFVGNRGMQAWFGMHSRRPWKAIMLKALNRKPRKAKAKRKVKVKNAKQAAAYLDRMSHGIAGRPITGAQREAINADIQSTIEARKSEQERQGRPNSEYLASVNFM